MKIKSKVHMTWVYSKPEFIHSFKHQPWKATEEESLREHIMFFIIPFREVLNRPCEFLKWFTLCALTLHLNSLPASTTTYTVKQKFTFIYEDQI